MRKIILLLLISFLLVFPQNSCSKVNIPSTAIPTTTSEQTTPTTTPEPLATLLPTAVPTPETIDSNAWVLSLSDDEILSWMDLLENNLLFAEKIGFRSSVYKRNIRSGSQITIYEFDEYLEADNSGNHWTGLPPNISLSPDKQILAFIDAEGLKTFNLQTKEKRTFIHKLSDSLPGSEIPPKWSVPALDVYAYYISIPVWSSNGKFISFQEAEYEGSCIGMVYSETGEYVEDITYAPVTKFRWSQTGESYVIASSYMQDMGPNGLFVSNQGNVKEIKNIATEHTQIEFTDYKDACYSPDGLKIAFIYEKCLEDDTRIMGVATSNVDGKELSVSFEGKEIYNPFYDTTGNFIFCFQTKNDRQVLVRYDISKHQTTDLAVFPENYFSNGTVQWTKDGYLALSVIIGEQDIYNSQFTTRYIILDLTYNIVIYASPISSAFTRFDSLLN